MDPRPSQPGSPEAPAGKAVETDMTDACGRRSEFALIRRGAGNWHKFCRELLAARVRSDGSLSTPQAAGGGGQRPAFTGICRPLKSAAEIGGVAASHVLLPRTFSDQAGKRAG